ncbi:MAG: FadR/GntR family transcriptional regulator [Dongiaceae bacterium]
MKGRNPPRRNADDGARPFAAADIRRRNDGRPVEYSFSAAALEAGEPVRHVRLSDQVYEHVFRQIASGQLAIGGRLPTEAQLCDTFDVSRPVVRDALARLRADGLISSRQGSGSYVERRPDRDFLRFAPSGNIADLLRCFEFRIGFEGDSAFFAAERRTAEHLATIRRALDELAEANRNGALGQKADLAFHMAIAAASGNYFYVRTMQMVERYMEFGMRLARSISVIRGAERLDLVQREHMAIYDAIRIGDGQAARAAVQLHIASARARILTEDPLAALQSGDRPGAADPLRRTRKPSASPPKSRAVREADR